MVQTDCCYSNRTCDTVITWPRVAKYIDVYSLIEFTYVDFLVSIS